MIYLLLSKVGRDAAVHGDTTPLIGIGLPPLMFMGAGILLQFGKNYGWNRRLEKVRDRIALVFILIRRFIVRLIRSGGRRRAQSRQERRETEGMVQTFVFPSRLDVHIIKSFLSIYFLVQSSLVMLLLLVEYTQISKFVQKNDASMDLVLRYLIYKIPFMLHFSMFMCLLIAVLILFAVMSKHEEITVIRAGGGSLQRLCFPLILCGALASGLSYYMENAFMPQANRLANRLNKKIKNQRENLFYRDVWLKRPSGEILNYQIYDEKAKALRGVRIYQMSGDTWDVLERVELPSLVYNENNGTWVTPDPAVASVFTLTGDFSYSPKPIERGQAFNLQLDLEDLSQKKHKATEFSIQDLKDYLDYLKSLGHDDTAYRTSLYAKYAQPLTPFIMMMLAATLGFQFGRKGAFYGIGTGLVAGLLFFGLFEMFKKLGTTGLIAPVAAGWTVVVLFGFVAIYRFINLE